MVAEIVRDAPEHASRRLSARGLPPTPAHEPHATSRTCISIALVANRFECWGHGQVATALEADDSYA
jgi:hypothetical protein